MVSSHSSHNAARAKDFQLGLLVNETSKDKSSAVSSAPIFGATTLERREHRADNIRGQISQYGLLGGVLNGQEDGNLENGDIVLGQSPIQAAENDPRLFFNVTVPSSTFICGSQGSGKSHTLSCLLENCLIRSDAGVLNYPLTGIVFHYDTFISDDGGSPCEAAFLSSNADVAVRVLCAPTNLRTIEKTYSCLNVDVEALKIDETDLNTKRMLDLMAVSHDEGAMPLYLHTVTRILRQMRMKQQELDIPFSYTEFKTLLDNAGLLGTQVGPLEQRLQTLESFLYSSGPSKTENKKKSRQGRGTDWSSKSGQLTIVDLSCPCVTPTTACSLFNIALSLFLEQNMERGRVVALDEAHKFMNASAEATTFTNSLLSTIRLQRHLGVRVIISTQEPTISPVLLDLSSLTIVHRFTSPEWLRSLRSHLAGATIGAEVENDKEQMMGNKRLGHELFNRIVRLRTGEALLFCPSAVIEPESLNEGSQVSMLGAGYLRIYIRQRLTTDGGRSVMAE